MCSKMVAYGSHAGASSPPSLSAREMWRHGLATHPQNDGFYNLTCLACNARNRWRQGSEKDKVLKLIQGFNEAAHIASPGHQTALKYFKPAEEDFDQWRACERAEQESPQQDPQVQLEEEWVDAETDETAPAGCVLQAPSAPPGFPPGGRALPPGPPPGEPTGKTGHPIEAHPIDVRALAETVRRLETRVANLVVAVERVHRDVQDIHRLCQDLASDVQ